MKMFHIMGLVVVFGCIMIFGAKAEIFSNFVRSPRTLLVSEKQKDPDIDIVKRIFEKLIAAEKANIKQEESDMNAFWFTTGYSVTWFCVIAKLYKDDYLFKSFSSVVASLLFAWVGGVFVGNVVSFSRWLIENINKSTFQEGFYLIVLKTLLSQWATLSPEIRAKYDFIEKLHDEFIKTGAIDISEEDARCIVFGVLNI